MRMEYLVVRADWARDSALTDVVNAYAHDGWKLISCSPTRDEIVFCFERPKSV